MYVCMYKWGVVCIILYSASCGYVFSTGITTKNIMIKNPRFAVDLYYSTGVSYIIVIIFRFSYWLTIVSRHLFYVRMCVCVCVCVFVCTRSYNMSIIDIF